MNVTMPRASFKGGLQWQKVSNEETQVSFRLNPLKSTGAKDDQGKTK
jgi:hypothetical protein